MSWREDIEETEHWDPEQRPEPNIRLASAFDEATAATYTKRTWWVRNDSRKDGDPGRWVSLDGYPDGTEELELRLGPGRYTIGAGPPEAFRREIRIDEAGQEITTRAPCLTVGCPGLVDWRPSAPPPACEPFALAPPADRLCSSCKGGS